MMEFDFFGKTVLVTGYFSDIGYGICDMYFKNNARVISTYNRTYMIDRINSSVELFHLDLEDLKFHQAVYEGYEAVCKMYPERIHRVDGNRKLDLICKDCISLVLRKIGR